MVLQICAQQECIPVGCVPPAAVANSLGGSASVHAGIHHPTRCGPGDPLPGVGLETPSQVWAWGPPQVWAWRPPRPDPSTSSPGCGPGDPPGQTPQLPPLGVSLETCKACWDTPPPGDLQGMLGYHQQGMLGYHPSPVDRMTGTCKNITFANFVCGR